jgi:hypothetical protein
LCGLTAQQTGLPGSVHFASHIPHWPASLHDTSAVVQGTAPQHIVAPGGSVQLPASPACPASPASEASEASGDAGEEASSLASGANVLHSAISPASPAAGAVPFDTGDVDPWDTAPPSGAASGPSPPLSSVHRDRAATLRTAAT